MKIRLVNDMDQDHPMHHPFHIHGAGRFLVLARDGADEPNLAWKDTVLVRSGETVDILLDVTNPGLWMAHCHIAEHNQSGMMFSFPVREAVGRDRHVRKSGAIVVASDDAAICVAVRRGSSACYSADYTITSATHGRGSLDTGRVRGEQTPVAPVVLADYRSGGAVLLAKVRRQNASKRAQHFGGIAVHIGARVSALAGAGEVFTTSTVKDLVAGSGIVFTDLGLHERQRDPRPPAPLPGLLNAQPRTRAAGTLRRTGVIPWPAAPVCE